VDIPIGSMNNASIKVRFLTTFITNILRVGLSFFTGLIIARALGPSDYGNFTFLLGSFTSLAALVDMATSSAFYTFISQRQRGRKFFFYYAVWIITQLLILLIFTLFVPDSLRYKIWLGQPGELILLALLVTFSTNLIWRLAGHLGESVRDTVGVQVRNLALAVAYLGSVIVLAGLHITSIKNLLIVNVLLYLVFSALYLRRIYRGGTVTRDADESLKSVFAEFKSFCLPLVIYTGIGFLYSFADYWLLQKFGGAVQQGYYAIGARFAALSLIATTSILQIFWKEIAEAHAQGKAERVKTLYQQISRSLLFVGAVISCALIPFSREILTLLLGASYQAAWVPLSLMFLYPVHQSMGQITGTMLFATGRTKIKSLIGIFFMILSIFTAYFMLAPKDLYIPGLNMGAMGLALKMLMCQFIEVNLMAFFVSRYINAPFDWCHQLYVLILLLPLGFVCKFFAAQILSFFYFGEYMILVMAASALFYLIAVTYLVRFFPAIAGLRKDQIEIGISWLRSRLSPS
jgi:O-antigen/teichoic acid export membrane protein